MMLKVGDHVRFRRDISWPPEWARRTWTITRLGSGVTRSDMDQDFTVAQLRARGERVMEGIDTRVLVKAGWWYSLLRGLSRS